MGFYYRIERNLDVPRKIGQPFSYSDIQPSFSHAKITKEQDFEKVRSEKFSSQLSRRNLFVFHERDKKYYLSKLITAQGRTPYLLYKLEINDEDIEWHNIYEYEDGLIDDYWKNQKDTDSIKSNNYDTNNYLPEGLCKLGNTKVIEVKEDFYCR